MLYQRAPFMLSEKFVAKQARRTGVEAKETTSKTMFFHMVRTFLTRFPKTFNLSVKSLDINEAKLENQLAANSKSSPFIVFFSHFFVF